MNLQVHLGNLTLSNPVILASGTAGYGREIAPYLDLDRIGALTLKGISSTPWVGNPPPRIHETYAGIMNSIGLENKGFDRFLREDLPFLENFQTKYKSISNEQVNKILEDGKVKANKIAQTKLNKIKELIGI